VREEHTTRIQIKIDDVEAQASIERLVTELKRAQDIAQNLLVGGAGGAGAITGAAQVAGASGAVNGGGTSTTASGGGARDAQGRFTSGDGGDGGGGGTYTTAGGEPAGLTRAQRHSRAIAGVGRVGMAGMTGGAGAGAAMLQTGLNVAQSTFKSLSNQPIVGVAAAGAGMMASGAGALMGQVGGYGQGQMQRNQIMNMMGFDPGIAGAFRTAGTPYDAAQYGHGARGGPGGAGAWGGKRAYPGLGFLGADPTQLGYSPQAALGILGGAAQSFGHKSYATINAGRGYTNPFVMSNRGASPAAFRSLAGRAKVDRDIESVWGGKFRALGKGKGESLGVEQLLAHGELNLGLTGSGINKYMGRIGGMAGIPGGQGGAMDIEGLTRVMTSGAGKKAGMQTLSFAEKAMSGGMGAYQNTLSSFGNMPELLSMSYAARTGKGGIEGFLKAQERFGSNSRLAAEEVGNVFGRGTTGSKIAFRQMGVGSRNIDAFSKQDFSVKGTSGAPFHPTQLDKVARAQIKRDQGRLKVARATAQTAVDTQRAAITTDSDAEAKIVQLVNSVGQLNIAMIKLGRVLTPLTNKLAQVMAKLGF